MILSHPLSVYLIICVFVTMDQEPKSGTTLEQMIILSGGLLHLTRSDQPEPPAVAIVRQNGLSSASSRASVADTPVSRQIW